MKREEFLHKIIYDEISLFQMLILYIFIKTGQQIKLNVTGIDVYNYHDFLLEIKERLFKEYSIVTLSDANNNIIGYY